MEEGDFDFFRDCIEPILLRNGFEQKSWLIENNKFISFVYKYFKQMVVYYNSGWLSIHTVHHLYYPVKLKHNWFTKKPYLKFKTLNLNKYKNRPLKELEGLITKSIKLINQYQKEVELQKDFG